ncbi:tetratricopeptide repeat protein [Roseibium sediminicola]|uniref:TPR repeat n=1 Tax=Roseibium sediminicola TaxID=2933272 RepID=A0ABT0GYL9_9HYPH|nr:hypothetical protein [Roseibium sp. CAU 1639]MCK7614157.1 hypothetical protein [Roseibium sp. CAU 1639]
MRLMRSTKTRLATGLSVGTVWLCLSGVAAYSTPIALEFRPPEIEATRICTPKRPDSEILREWIDWDRTALPSGKNIDTIARDLVRLRDIDAAGYFDTIMAGLEQLRRSDPGYSDSRYLIDRINVYINAGRIADLKKARLIAELQASGYMASPRAIDFLADLHLNGIVVERDPELGLKLKVQAAYGGNANALLHLAALTSSGEEVPGWDVDAPVAVTLAFGALLGKLNPTICDRIGRIAREYSSGEVVQKDHGLSETWYRFAADLGDTNAAWKVAEYHLDSEFIEKDNSVLLKYLKEAASAGVVSAKIELGRIYETGSLTERNAEAALELYNSLAASGLRVGYIRSILLREKLGQTDGADFDSYFQSLVELSELPDAPGWVFTKLGKLAQDQDGIWDSAGKAEELFARAAALDDVDGKYELARTYLLKAQDRTRFNMALDLLYSAVSDNGKIEALSELRRAHLCLNPDGPDVSSEHYWRAAESGAGNETISIGVAEVGDLQNDLPPMLLAEVQTQALYGRAEALGNFANLLERVLENVPEPTKAFWQSYAARYDGGEASIVVRSFEAAETEEDRSEAIDSLRQLIDDGDQYAALELADIFLRHYAEDFERVAEAEYLLAAFNGGTRGKILRLLENIRGGGQGDPFQLTAEQVDHITAHGDADALLFLAAHEANGEQRQQLYFQARGIMRCNFDTVYQFAEFAAENDLRDELNHWLRVSMALLEGKAWQLVKVADLYAGMDTDAGHEAAFNLYVSAHDLGYDIASFRLLDLVSEPERATYDPVLGTEIFSKLLAKADGNQLYGVIRRVQKAPDAIRNPVLAQHDIKALYRRAAEAEYPAAMRELAKLMRSSDASHEDIREASDWLKKSAAAEDVEAMVLLAQSYAFGIGLEPSRSDALKWLKAASEAGDDSATKLLQIIQLQ